jgi:hypothetical protein
VEPPELDAAASMLRAFSGEPVAAVFHPDDREAFDIEQRAKLEALGVPIVESSHVEPGAMLLVPRSDAEELRAGREDAVEPW